MNLIKGSLQSIETGSCGLMIAAADVIFTCTIFPPSGKPGSLTTDQLILIWDRLNHRMQVEEGPASLRKQDCLGRYCATEITGYLHVYFPGK